MVFRLPQYVWGHGGSFFIPQQLDTARKLRKAYYLLPGRFLLPMYTLKATLMPVSPDVHSARAAMAPSDGHQCALLTHETQLPGLGELGY